VVLHVEENVRVGVEGDAYGAMAKEFLERSWVSSSCNEQCGGSWKQVGRSPTNSSNALKLRRFMLDASRSLPSSVANMNPDRSAGYVRWGSYPPRTGVQQARARPGSHS
jgi:hypothetical protein